MFKHRENRDRESGVRIATIGVKDRGHVPGSRNRDNRSQVRNRVNLGQELGSRNRDYRSQESSSRKGVNKLYSYEYEKWFWDFSTDGKPTRKTLRKTETLTHKGWISYPGKGYLLLRTVRQFCCCCTFRKKLGSRMCFPLSYTRRVIKSVIQIQYSK